MTRKNKIILAISICMAVLVFVAIVCIVLYSTMLISPYIKNKMNKYYSSEDSYVSFSGVIMESNQIKNSGDMDIFVESSDESFNDFKYGRKDTAVRFVIISANVKILKDNGFNFNSGEKYTFISAPEYWYSSFIYPIVSIASEDGQISYLNYDSGKNNWLKYIATLK